MKLLPLITLCIPLTLSFHLVADTTNTTLKTQIQQCENCHSESAASQSIAPVLNGMSEQYLKDQMENFAQDKRRVAMEETPAINDAHTSLASDEESLSLVSEYYAELERRVSSVSVDGDASSGESLFEDDCASCHTSTFGRYLSASPEITHLEGPYILKQMKAFSDGQRSFTNETKSHRKMVNRIQQYSDKELSDNVEYINANEHTL